jgi:hypothetical protein
MAWRLWMDSMKAGIRKVEVAGLEGRRAWRGMVRWVA